MNKSYSKYFFSSSVKRKNSSSFCSLTIGRFPLISVPFGNHAVPFLTPFQPALNDQSPPDFEGHLENTFSWKSTPLTFFQLYQLISDNSNIF